MKTIVFEPRAARQFDRLPAEARAQITEGLARYAMSGIGDVKKLQNRPGFRLRIGRFRVLYSENQAIILAIEIVRRSETTY